MPYISRRADDDFEAKLIADAAEKVGALVVSITFDGQHQRPGAMAPCSRFQVWVRIRDGAHADEWDAAIDAAFANR
jgi:hypothetical protein